jgi:CubicO group peptidase (beta-lactamase class C family)
MSARSMDLADKGWSMQSQRVDRRAQCRLRSAMSLAVPDCIRVNVGVAVTVAIVSFAVSAGVAQNPTVARDQSPSGQSIEAQVDTLFAQWNKPDSPGCSVAVGQNGAVVYERGYGMANLELGVPIGPTSVFEAASISKAFTATSMMLLTQRGRVSIDDEVRKYIPEWSDERHRVTLRHLLSHTGGLRDVFLLVELAAPHRPGGDVNEWLVHLLARQRGLNFTPGSDFQYNNGAYVVLAEIVKRVSGQSLGDFAEVNIFKPLGMSHSRFQDDGTTIVPNRVSGYYREGGDLRQAVGQAHPPIGNSGLLSTARDLLLWLQNFADARVGDAGLLSQMQTPAVIAGGYKGTYGLGLEVGEDHGLKTIGHGGGGGGWGAYAVRYPDHGLNVALLCNLDEIGWTVGALARSVARLYLDAAARSTSTPPEDLPRVSLSPEQLASKAGLYRDPVNGTIGRVFVRDGRLMASADPSEEGQVFEIVPISPNRFVIPGTPIVAEFIPPAGGRPQEIRVTGAGPKPQVSRQVTGSFSPSPVELRAFAGEYSSPELEVRYIVAARDSRLIIRTPGRADIPLWPLLADTFYAPRLVDVVRFSRDRQNVVRGFTLHSEGAWGLRFDRAVSHARRARRVPALIAHP